MPPLTDAAAWTPEAVWERYGEAILSGAFNLVVALALLFAGVWASGWLARAVRRIAQKSERIDDTLAAFFASIVRYGALAVVAIAVLDRFGVQTTQIITVLGAATLAVGLALQGTLSNVAAGVMLVLFRPYKLGDFVEVAGQKGMVRDINIFTTELETLDRVRIVLPNGQCWGAPISNFTHHPTRRVELEFRVAYRADFARARAILEETLRKDPRVLADPAPFAMVSKLGDYAVTISAYAWCATGDLVALKSTLTTAGMAALEAGGFATPYPTTIAYNMPMPVPDAGAETR